MTTTTLALDIRRHTLQMVTRACASHVGGCLSIADLLAVLYGEVLRIDPQDPDWQDRDRFILSKGHACAALYAALAVKGFFPVEELEQFGMDGSRLTTHAGYAVPGVELSTGSLGHGLPVSCGLALAAKRDHKAWRTFVLVSDGECEEGSTWEAALFAGHHGLDNLVAIVDANGLQGLGTVREILNLDPLADKLRDFGWAVHEIDGHEHEQIRKALLEVPCVPGKPTAIIAHTIKGKGVSFMEHKLEWHYKSPSAEQLLAALLELGTPE